MITLCMIEVRERAAGAVLRLGVMRAATVLSTVSCVALLMRMNHHKLTAAPAAWLPTCW